MGLSEEDNLWRPLGRLLIFLLFIIIFSSCGKKELEEVDTIDFSREEIEKVGFSKAKIFEAKNRDILVPLGFKLVGFQESLNALQSDGKNFSEYAHYTGFSNISNVLNFYLKNLEDRGWRINNMSVEEHGLLICKKPSKNFVISFCKSEINEKKVHIYVYIKDTSNKEEKIVENINSKKVFLSENLVDKKFYKGSKEG